MAHLLAPQAVEDLDGIWPYVATESGNVETANRLIDSITDRFFLLAHSPYMGRVRDEDFGSPMGIGGSQVERRFIFCSEVYCTLHLTLAEKRKRDSDD